MTSIQLHGKIFLSCTIRTITGLHIGRNSNDLDIGGIDNPVIRDPLSKEPYIPGSSLRGKMRSLLDRHLNNPLKTQGNVRVGDCKTPEDYIKCPVSQVFGVAPTGKLSGKTMPTRLIVRDASLTKASRDELKAAETDSLFTEAKWEVSIDRITSEANPRQNERVPAGAKFCPVQLVYGIYTLNEVSAEQLKRECELFDTVLKGMALLEDDYLGGAGSRGSGQIAFEDLKLTFKSRTYYEEADASPVIIAESKDIKALRQSGYTTGILSAINAE